ncbi:hypothetical protein P0136_04935 [Lentisphaerota bacterium ZTH]|nr:hypothetical protein JYG24_03945 [Lentisphaerota bacterium]WET07335.1 hypothetical protein P0136_04935 [Lentisphaerota bacterium ZTH]
MKTGLTAAVLTTAVIFSSVNANADGFKDKWRSFKNKVHAKVENLKQHLQDRMNSPEVQARLAEIRARHRQITADVLRGCLESYQQYKLEVRPMLKARLELRIAEIRLKIGERFRFYRSRARRKYEAKLSEIIGKLPPNLAAGITGIRASEQYQSFKAGVRQKIYDFLKIKLKDTKLRARAKVNQLVNRMSEKFENWLEEKIAELEA